MEELNGLIRHVLTFGGGFMVANSTLTEVELTSVVGAIMTIWGTYWSYRQKKQ